MAAVVEIVLIKTLGLLLSKTHPRNEQWQPHRIPPFPAAIQLLCGLKLGQRWRAEDRRALIHCKTERQTLEKSIKAISFQTGLKY